MFKNPPWILSFLVLVLIPLYTPTVVHAEEEIMEEILVTGSRIPRPNMISNSPINVVTSEDVELSGVINTEQFINELPQLAPDLTSTTNNGGSGIATLDLRGLGANRTLILVNGRRFLASDNEGQVDINNIPAPLIERVEVVTGGASAVYGSDAVAGAINFILKDDFEGVELGGNYNLTNEGDGDTRSINALIGGNFADDRGNAVIYADYTERDEVLAGARRFSEVALTDFGAFGIPGFFELGSSRIPGGAIIQNDLVFPGGVVANDASFQPDGTPQPRNGETFNFQPDNFLQTPQERLLLNANATYATSENSELYFEGTIVNSRSDQQLAFDANDIPDVGSLFVSLDNPLISANPTLVDFLTTNFDQGINGDVTAGDGIASIADFRRRQVEAGPRFTEYEFDAIRLLIGARGDIGETGWTYDVYYSSARANISEGLDAFTSDLRIQQALLASDDGTGNAVCNDPSGGCVPISLFGLGALSPEGATFISPSAAVRRETEQDIFNLSFAGSLVELPAGDLGFAAGFEYREETAESQPDAVVQSGELGPGNDEFPVVGDYDVTEFYVEALIPIIEGLELELGARISDYSTVGSVTSFKAGGSYAINDSFRIRGLFQRAVRAPNIFELFQARAAGSESATDLCTAAQIGPEALRLGRSEAEVSQFCNDLGVPNPGTFVADSQILTVQSGNLDLVEEEANTITFGFLVTPESIPNFSFSMDYYNIEVEDAIDDLDADVINRLCLDSFDVNSQFCQAIDRNPVNGSIEELRSLRLNLATEDREGIDWQAEYGFDALGGSWNIRQIGNFTLTNEFTPLPGSPAVDCNAIFGGQCTGLGNFAQPEWRLTNYITYSREKWTIRAQLRVIGPLENVNADAVAAQIAADPSVLPLAIDETTEEYYVDISGQYRFNENLSFVVGVENIGDVTPPILGFDFGGRGGGADANTDPSLYDVLGRRFFLQATYRFGE